MPPAMIQRDIDPRQDPLFFTKGIDQFTNEDHPQTIPTFYIEALPRIQNPPPPPLSRKRGKRRNKQDQMDFWPMGRAVNGVTIRWPDPRDFRKGAFAPTPPEPEPVVEPEPEVDETIELAADNPLFPSIDLKDDDELDLKLAKLMFNRFVYDVGFKGYAEVTIPDKVHLFRRVAPNQKRKVMRTLDMVNAIVWLYSMHPQQVQLSSEWVCDMMDLDIESVRRIVARNCRDMIKKTVQLLFQYDRRFGQECLDKASDYFDVTDWSFE